MADGDRKLDTITLSMAAWQLRWDLCSVSLVLISKRSARKKPRYLALGTDIGIWPEAAIPMWYNQANEYLAELGALAEQAGNLLLIGVPIREAEGRIYTVVVSLSHLSGFYYKRTWCP